MKILANDGISAAGQKALEFAPSDARLLANLEAMKNDRRFEAGFGQT